MSDSIDTETMERSFEIEPYLMTILSKKFEMASREMTQSLLKSARSGVINVARDFSSAITLYDGRQFMIDEGLPCHAANIQFTPQYTLGVFDDIEEGDCFLTNSSFAGCTHHADYTLHVPVFYDGEPLFWTAIRAHQADCAAPEPATYLPWAKDIYEEGIHFPSVRTQENYEDKDDIIRMCKLNIRLGEEQWYGDYLGQVSGVRTGEEAIHEICDEYGVDLVKTFSEEWIEYGERMMRQEISELPDTTIQHTAYHDPIHINDAAPDGVPITVKLDIRPDEEKIVADIRDNMENIPAGFNLSKATTVASIYGGIFANLDSNIPHNNGSISRIDIKMDKGKIVGEPEYPVGTSVATTNINDTLYNAVQASFGQLGEPYGIAEGNPGMPPQWGVISGSDFRRDGEQYINQLFHTAGGGPGVHGHDGWNLLGIVITGGVMYRDSLEIDEQKFPILIKRNHLLQDSGGPGKWRGAPGSVSEFGPREDPMSFSYYCNAAEFPPQGILGGEAGDKAGMYIVNEDGSENHDLPTIGLEEIDPGQTVVGLIPGGGGYGNPLERETEMILHDVKEGYVSRDGAREDYGVVIEETTSGLAVDSEATEKLREEMAEEKGVTA